MLNGQKNWRDIDMKKIKRMISLVLALAMVMALLVTGASAQDGKSEKHYMTFMGDSVATGFGLNQPSNWSNELKTRPDGVTKYYFKRPLGDSVAVPGSYISIVANALGADTSNPTQVPFLYNQTRAGFRSIEALRMLDPAYDQEMMGDTYGNEGILTGYAEMTEAELKYMKENAAKQVANSKLVVIQLGSNDISLAVTDIAPARLADILAQEEKTISTRGLLEATKKVLEQGGDLTSILVTALGWAEAVDAVPETIAAYASAMVEGIATWVDVIKRLTAKVYEINPDCTVVMVGLYNAFKEMKLTDFSPISEIYYLVEPSTVLSNLYLKNLSPFVDSDEYDYRFVDVTAMELNGLSNPLLTSIMNGELAEFSMEYAEQIHPSAEGHKYMAQQILDALGPDFSLHLENAQPDPITPVGPDYLYSDVNSNDWFYSMVKYVTENGYMAGTAANVFSPNAPVSRAMVAQILYAMEGKPAAPEGKFSDVKAGDWFADAVNWAASQGVVAGFEDGTFQPNADVTREQLAVILSSYAKMKGQDGTATADLSGFGDASQISGWAQDGVRWSVEKGLISGKPGNIIDPKGTATRAEMATMIMNLKTKVL